MLQKWFDGRAYTEVRCAIHPKHTSHLLAVTILIHNHLPATCRFHMIILEPELNVNIFNKSVHTPDTQLQRSTG
jgi:hypothetical protein